jgi:hypothetical protein
MNVPGDSRQERLNNVIRLIGQEAHILDCLLQEFTEILLSSSKIRIAPALRIREVLAELSECHLKTDEYTVIG